MSLTFRDGDGATCGLAVKFANLPTYNIRDCTPSPGVTFTMPDGEVQKWTITKYPNKLKLHCNGVEVFNFKFSDSSEARCVGAWSSDKVAFKFDGTDTSGDSYRAVPNYGK